MDDQRHSTFDRLRVAVLVDLLWRPDAGGHVKCWERLSEAVARSAPEIDLTVHFEGEAERVVERAANVRFHLHRPVLGSARIPFLRGVPDHTDLAPYHPGVARALAACDLVHTTDAFFAFARTAERVSAARRIPLVNSIHTDTPRYARVFSGRILESLVGRNALSRLLVDRLRMPEAQEHRMLRRLARHQGGAAFALVSRPDELDRARGVLPPDRLGLLRRGVDRAVFSPGRRDRGWLRAAYGVPEDVPLVLFAGRMNRGKNVMALARAVRILIDGGRAVHLLCAGEGEEREAVRAVLGSAATCPGVVPQAVLAGFYASCDLFALPSEIEVNSNVVREALACGAPVAVAVASGAGAMIQPDRTGIAVDGGGAAAWADALGPALSSPHGLAAMRRAATDFGRDHLPSWDAVLREDLLPVWMAVSGQEVVPCTRIASSF